MLINPSALRTAELKFWTADMKSLTAKNPAMYILNKALSLIFSDEEIKNAKGARAGLNSYKMDALKGIYT